jgi:4-amino-4-deoxy-L-arabinose transferase-like glycosyltransferase
MLNRRLELILVTSLLVLAAALRIWDLTRLPPGFSDDELAFIRIAETVRQGDVAVYYQVGDLQARAGPVTIGHVLITELTGDGMLGYRLLSLWAGLGTLALLYTFARRLFGGPVALIALGVMAVNFRMILLARTPAAESVMPAYVLLVLLVLAIAFNLRRDITFHAPGTLPFALLALLLGGAGYLNYTGLVLGPLAALFLAHLIYTRQPISRRVWSAAIFVVVLATVVGTPYLISTFRDTNLSEPYILSSQRPHSVGDVIDGIASAVGGVFWHGDERATRNLPDLPLIGPVQALLALVGVITAGRRWREPRYALVLLALAAGLLTDAWVGTGSTFSANLVALPAIFILVGIGTMSIWHAVSARDIHPATPLVAMIVLAVLAANLIAVRSRLFDDWNHDKRVYAAYHANLGYLAAYLDRTPDGLPVSLCSARLNEPVAVGLTPRQMLGVMQHRDDLDIRHSDCGRGLVLIGAGAPMRFTFADVADREMMPPELASWLQDGQPIPVEGLEEGSVLYLDVEQRVRDSGGQWDALAPAYYMPDESGQFEAVELPVQMEQNLTFAGYDPRVLASKPVPGGEHPLVVVTYWRVDGPLPKKLGIFAHLLGYTKSEPRVLQLEPWAENNGIDVIPSELKNRDFFIQVSHVWLGDTLDPGEYALTVGAYVDTAAVLDNHLDPLDPALDFQPHGDRLFLGPIMVQPKAEEPEPSEPDANTDTN